MFEKLKGLVNYSTVEVQLLLDKPAYEPGAMITGNVYIESGESQTNIESIHVALVATASDTLATNESEIACIPLAMEAAMESNEKRILSFSYELPSSLPYTNEDLSYVMQVRVQVDGETSQNEQYPLVIRMPDYVAIVLKEMQHSGFEHTKDFGTFNGREHNDNTQFFSFIPPQHLKEELKCVVLSPFIEKNGILLQLRIEKWVAEYKWPYIETELFLDEETLQNPINLSHMLREGIEKHVGEK